MPEQSSQETVDTRDRGKLLRPRAWSQPDRHVSIAISHASDDPGRHRTFKVRASFDPDRDGWQAYVSPHRHNEQYGEWTLLLDGNAQRFPTAASCLGHAATVLIAAFDGEELQD